MSIQTTKTELENIVDKSTLQDDTKNMFKVNLKNQGIETLSQWKELSSDNKKIFPDGLQLLLNKEIGNQEYCHAYMWNITTKNNQEIGVNGYYSLTFSTEEAQERKWKASTSKPSNFYLLDNNNFDLFKQGQHFSPKWVLKNDTNCVGSETQPSNIRYTFLIQNPNSEKVVASVAIEEKINFPLAYILAIVIPVILFLLCVFTFCLISPFCGYCSYYSCCSECTNETPLRFLAKMLPQPTDSFQKSSYQRVVLTE